MDEKMWKLHSSFKKIQEITDNGKGKAKAKANEANEVKINDKPDSVTKQKEEEQKEENEKMKMREFPSVAKKWESNYQKIAMLSNYGK